MQLLGRRTTIYRVFDIHKATEWYSNLSSDGERPLE